MYMCKVFPSNRKCSKKDNAIYMKEVLDCLRHIDVGKRRNFLRHAKQFLVKFMSLNKSVKLKFHALLAKTSKN